MRRGLTVRATWFATYRRVTKLPLDTAPDPEPESGPDGGGLDRIKSSSSGFNLSLMSSRAKRRPSAAPYHGAAGEQRTAPPGSLTARRIPLYPVVRFSSVQ